MGPLGIALIGAGVGAGGNIIAGKMENDANARLNSQNLAAQKEFAQYGIRWRVADAEKAGLHPLAALGAQTSSFAPSIVGDTGMSDAVRNSGQDISRAISATRTADERMMAQLNLANARADLDGKEIDNQIRKAQLNKMVSVGPPFPGGDNFVPGQGNSGLVVDRPLQRTVSAPGRPAQEAGWRPDVAYARTDTGLTPVVPESLSESLEDDIVGKLLWRFRNQVMPNFGPAGAPPKHMLPRGYDRWEWSATGQEYRPRKSGIQEDPEIPFAIRRSLEEYRNWQIKRRR